jgi:integrase
MGRTSLTASWPIIRQSVTMLDLLVQPSRAAAQLPALPGPSPHRTPRRPPPLAVSTRARRLVALRSFLCFVARENWLPGDLGATLDVPKLPERLPKPLKASDWDDLLDALPHDTLAQKRDRALILLLLSTGARIWEILRLDCRQGKPEHLWVIGKATASASCTSPTKPGPQSTTT